MNDPDGPGRVTMRRAVAADAAAIADVFHAAVKSGWSYLGDLAAEPMFTSHDWDDLVAAHEPPSLLLVAVEEDAIVGYAAAHPEDGEMFLLFVHPGHAGRGIGRQLLAAADDGLRAAGCREAFLFVHELNTRAISVYQAAGYRLDGTDRISDFRGTTIREVRLTKQLRHEP
jgi:ribosomal protein S18 acetylase RimI-like enzyme